MRKSSLGLALVASAHLAFLTTPAFAEPPTSQPDVAPPSGTDSLPRGNTDAPPHNANPNPSKVRAGWIIVGVGAAATIGGIVIDAVGTGKGSLSGQGGVGDNGNTDNTRNDYYFVGTTLLVAGLAAAFYGGTMVWSGSRGEANRASDAPDTEARGDGASKALQAKLASAPAVSIPLLGARF